MVKIYYYFNVEINKFWVGLVAKDLSVAKNKEKRRKIEFLNKKKENVKVVSGFIQ